LRVVEVSAWENGSNSRAATVGRDPDPRVGHLEPKDRPSADAAGPAHADRHAALVRELERVAHEVQQDLAQPSGISGDDPGHIGLADATQLQPFGLRARGKELQRLIDDERQIEVDGLEIQAARLDLREIQDVVDDGEQGLPRAPYHVRVLALLECQWGVEQQTCHPDDAVHGRADLVAHHRQELALARLAVSATSLA
jgi:hypothetical protein